jgi:two-component system LytT family response regulator
MNEAPLRALIVDDEELARRLLREYLAGHADITVAGECDNGLAAVRGIQELQPDIVFLDIQMPKLTGLEVLELTGRRHGVVFTTAYDQHAVQAFDLHAVDYLLKPFSKTRFDEALAQCRLLLRQAPSAALDRLIARPPTPLERVLIRDREREQVHVIAVDKIDYIEAQADYVAIHAEGRDHLKSQTISELEAQLDARNFVRVHRSFIINLSQLRGIERAGVDGHAARMQDGKRIPISRTGYERLRSVM